MWFDKIRTWWSKRKTPQGIYGPATPGHRPVWARPFARAQIQTVMGVVASGLLLYSVGYGFYTVNCRNFEVPGAVQTDACKDTETDKTNVAPARTEEKRLTNVGLQKAILIMIWVLLPPIWFWLEYFGIWSYEDEAKRKELEQFKLGQELAAKIWLAAVTALGILYFGKDIKGGGG